MSTDRLPPGRRVRVRAALPTVPQSPAVDTPTGAVFVLEGPDGVGKSRQRDLLTAQLTADGFTVRALREPGDTPAARAMRGLLLDPQAALSSPSELFLFLAARADLWAHTIRPAVARGEVVLLDRSSLSTLAHQGAGRGLDPQWLTNLCVFAQGDLRPSATFVLTASAEVLAERLRGRGTPKDRMEADAPLQDRVRDFYARIAAPSQPYDTLFARQMEAATGRLVAIDASADEATVCETLAGITTAMLATTCVVRTTAPVGVAAG